jgi:hypothetical protein
MNSIKILHLDQCEIVIKDLLHLSGKQSEEIYSNMWCITLGDDLVKNIKIEQLKCFVEQALRLRFNVMTGDERILPFTCKLRLLNTYEAILKNFINTAQEVNQFGDDIQFFDRQDSNWDEDEDEQEYTLDVFVKKLNTKNYG